MAASRFPIGIYGVSDGALAKQKGGCHLNLSIRNPSLQRIAVFLLVMSLIWSLLGALMVAAAANSHKANGALAVPLGTRLHQFFPGPTPPSDATCRAMASRRPSSGPKTM